MDPKKAVEKDKNLAEIDEMERNQINRLEEELQELRQKLAFADKQVVETRLHAVNDCTTFTGILRKQEEVSKLEQDIIVKSFHEKMTDMCQEKDSVINDMQERVRVYREMQEHGHQRDEERRVRYRDDDSDFTTGKPLSPFCKCRRPSSTTDDAKSNSICCINY